MDEVTITEFQLFTRSTAVYPKEKALEYLGLGLCSEAGEVAGKIKKHIRGDVVLDENLKQQIKDELGDCLWYITRIADELGVDSEQILYENKLKLEDRQKRGVIKGSGDNR